MDKPKPFEIPKMLVWEAYKLIKANKGGAGVDRESLAAFEQRISKNLYKIWNRLSSGSYFPPAVRGIEIPKKQGGTRLLGVPTVADRIAQMTIKLMLEPSVEPRFLEDSYGYRPNKSALDAIGVTRKRCWEYNWLIEFDIKGLFDNIDHGLLMQAVRKYTDNKCILLYIERWIKAPLEMPDGSTVDRTAGTPQGGVISPILSNIFMHCVFDLWISKHHPEVKWCRYADDGLCHCKTLAEAEALLLELKQRFENCKLEMHPEKTKIISCKVDNQNTIISYNKSFEFLGYEFRVRGAENKQKRKVFSGFLPAISPKSEQGILEKIKSLHLSKRSDLSLTEIAKMINPLLKGWINYYGRYTKSAMTRVLKRVNSILVAWSRRKYLKLKNRKIYARKCMKEYAVKHNNLFVHWKLGITDVFI